MNNKTFYIVLAILVIVSIVGLASYLPARFEAAAEVKVSAFPKTIGQWQSTDIQLYKRDFEILETTNLIMREYKKANGEVAYLYIVYSGDNRNVVHPPEICYSGGGATIIKKSVLPLNSTLKVNKFIIDDKDSCQLVVYWFKSANFQTYNYFKQQLKVVTDRMLRKKTSGALIRISTNIKDGNENAALQLIKSFAAQIAPLLEKYVP